MKKIYLIFVFLLAACPVFCNYITNPSFESGSAGWGPWWERNSVADCTSISTSDYHDGVQSLHVVYPGSVDWSFPYAVKITVTAGEVFTYQAWIKSTASTGQVQLSVVTEDGSGTVMDWQYAMEQRTGTFLWFNVNKTFVIPNNCAKIQFRLTGLGACNAYIDGVYIDRIQNAPQALNISGNTYAITNAGTTLTLNGTTKIITVKKSSWTAGFSIESPGDGVITAITPTASTLSITQQQGNIVEASYSIDGSGDINCTYSITGSMTDDLSLPGRFLSAAGMQWVIPENEGLLVPSDDPYYDTWDRTFYGGHSGLCMPFIGITDGTRSAVYIAETPDDGYAKFTKPAGPAFSNWSFKWQAERAALEYDRKVKIKLVDGGYVAAAKAYRSYAASKGKLVTLAQKAAVNPNIDLLIGAVNLWWWSDAPSWGRNYNCTSVAQEIKNSGMTRVLWSNEASPQAVNDMNDMGFLTGRYDIYQDVFDPAYGISWFQTDGWPSDLVLDSSQNWVHGWVNIIGATSYPGGIICAAREGYWLDLKVPPDLSSHNYRARFLDTTTAAQLYECYSAVHPETRTDDRVNKSLLLDRVSGHYNMVTGSETGIDWAVPYLAYFEGMMSIADYRLPNSGYDLTTYIAPDANFLRFQTGPYYRIPLFELVYHDCVAVSWYWGDSSNRVPEAWDDRDLLNTLYATMPLYIMDPGIWAANKARFVQSYNTSTPIRRRVGYSEMTKHEFITADHKVQCTEFADGTRVCVNFGTASYTLSDGKVLPAKGTLDSISSSGPQDNLDKVYVYPSLVNMTAGDTNVCFRNLVKGSKINVYNLNGESVYSCTANSDTGELCWNLAGQRKSEKTAPGIYLYTVRAGGKNVKGKLAIIR